MSLVLLAWAAISVTLIWPIAVAFNDQLGFDEPDPIDWALALAMATVTAPFWPLAAAPFASWVLWNRINRLAAEREEATR